MECQPSPILHQGPRTLVRSLGKALLCGECSATRCNGPNGTGRDPNPKPAPRLKKSRMIFSVFFFGGAGRSDMLDDILFTYIHGKLML